MCGPRCGGRSDSRVSGRRSEVMCGPRCGGRSDSRVRGRGSEVRWRPTLWRAECGAGAVFTAFRNAFSSPWGSALHRIRAGFQRVSKRVQVGGGGCVV